MTGARSNALSTSGRAGNAIDALNDRYFYSVWRSSDSLPRSITIDLDREQRGIRILEYVPQYDTIATPVRQGSIESYKIYKSSDNVDFTEISSGEWAGDAKMKIATFAPAAARYVRLEALKAVGNYAAATEIVVGR